MFPQDLAMHLKTNQKEFKDKDNYKIRLLKTLKEAYDKVKNYKELEQVKYKAYFDLQFKGP